MPDGKAITLIFQNPIKLKGLRNLTPATAQAELALRKQHAMSPWGWGRMVAPAPGQRELGPSHSLSPHAIGAAASHALQCTKAFQKSLSVPQLLQPIKKK